MCGITGILSLMNVSLNVNDVKVMTDKIAHRGPDDAGYLLFHTGSIHPIKISFFKNLTDDQFYNNNGSILSIENQAVQNELHSHDWDLFMGHRRLSILDTSQAGHQPMSDLSMNIWLTFNGEIYNFKEIREELKSLGHRFKTNTDTEVIICSYIEWGIDCIKKLNGMFALALYDNFKKVMYLVRDRYGIKPLYYTQTKDKTLIYASEVKSILESSEVDFKVDKKALLNYFTFQNHLDDSTLYENIRLLPPASIMRVDLQKSKPEAPSIHQYWDFNFEEDSSLNNAVDCAKELDHLFKQAVNRQLVSDVEVGSYLSGGLDSGSIVAHASKRIDCLKTFTVGFDLSSAVGLELAFDERTMAEKLSYQFQTEQYEMVLKSGDMERCMYKFSYHLEEPRVGQSYPNYYAAKLASKFVKVVLSGIGGDELLAGYPWRYYPMMNHQNFDEYIKNYYQYWQRLLQPSERREVFAPIWDDVKDVDLLKNFRAVFKGGNTCNSVEGYVNQSLYFEAKTFLQGLLIVEDKLSMAHSLESRVPFLDNDLVDFIQRIPVKLKLANLEQVKSYKSQIPSRFLRKTNDGKRIFRDAMKNHVSKDLRDGIKQGFSSPDQSWFKGESIEFVRRKLLNPNAKIYDFFDQKAIEKLILKHLEGKENKRLLIWSLLNFEEWYALNE